MILLLGYLLKNSAYDFVASVQLTRTTLASAVISCRRVSVRPFVCPSVTSQYSTEMAKRRITQNYAQGLYLSNAENLGKTQTGSPPTEAPNTGGVG